MKITIYTITDCQFSKAEKDYLTSKNIPFEEKNLETNREFLTEMLNLSNNFAGTPVTKIEKDDGQTEVIKGFTPEEFDKALGFAAPAAQTAPVEQNPAETMPAPAAVAPVMPPVAAMPPITPTPAVTESIVPPPAPAPMSMEPPSAAPVDPNANTQFPQTAPTMDQPMSLGVDPLSSAAPTMDMQAPAAQPMSNEPPQAVQQPSYTPPAPIVEPPPMPAAAPIAQPAPTSEDLNTQNALNAVLNNLQEKSDDEGQSQAA
ncbi:MAG: glutaredoxin domain-containing protein [Weeksellaceae bacterium]